jgi:hypothetical protein
VRREGTGNGPQIDSPARTGLGTWRTDQTRQKPTRKRARRRALDRVMWTAAGAALGAGLVTITVYIMIGDWI